MAFVDTHIHLYAEEFKADREQLIRKALQNGIERFYLPNIDSDSIAPMLELENTYPGHCFAMMGLHPCSVAANYKAELQTVKDWLDRRPFAGVGEIGLDLYWDKTFFSEQVEALSMQIEWALDLNYPIIIHCRNAHAELVKLFKSFSRLPRGIFHCFSGTLAEAEELLALGDFKLGIGGVLTFKNSGLAKVIESIDIQHLVLETDAPYLAPVPFRGKRNEPVYLLEVAKCLAELKGLDMDELGRISSRNASTLFKTA